MRITAFLCTAAFCFLATTGYGQVISWDGGGDGTTWSDPLNWVGNVLPGPTNDVVISVGTAATIKHTTGSTTVRSLQCDESFQLTGGTLTLTNGASYVNGSFTINPGRTFTVSNSISAFSANGPTVISSANLLALNGGQMTLSNALSYVHDGVADYTIRAQGAGATIDLSAVTNFAGSAAANDELFVEAIAGGEVILSSVPNFPAGGLDLLANGAGSVVDLASLTNFVGYNFFNFTGIEAIAGGSINMPNLVSLNGVTLRLDATGTMDTAQINLLTNSSIRIDGNTVPFTSLANLTSSSVILTNGGTADLSNAANINGSSFDVSGGVALSFPAAVNYVAGNCYFRARGAGSILDLSTLTNLVGAPFNANLTVEATGGGVIDLSNVLQFPSGAIDILASGTGSLVDLPALTLFVGMNNFNYTGLEATNGGTINIPNLTTLSSVHVRPWPGGSMQTTQFNVVTNGSSFLAKGFSIDLSGITNLSGSSFTATNGGTLNLTNAVAIDGASFFIGSGVTQALPAATSYRNVGGDHSLVAHGAGTVLDLSTLTNLAGSSTVNQDLAIRALAGGTVLLPNVQQISPAGAVDIKADGTNSLVDLSSASTFLGFNNFTYSGLEAINGGTILVPSLRVIYEVNLLPAASGTLQTSQLHVFTNSTIVADGTAIDFSGVTNFSKSTATAENGGTINLNSAVNIDGASFDVSGGVTLSLPAARSYTQTGLDCFFRARGAGSLLDLSSVTNVVGGGLNADLFVEATSGGTIDLSGTLQFPNGAIDVLASGSGSLVDLPLLTRFIGMNNFNYTGLEATNGGTINIPSLTTLSSVHVRPWPSGSMQVEQFTTMTNGCTIVANGFPIDLSGITNLAGSTLTLTNGGTMDLPNARNIDGCSVYIGSGVTLSFPQATNFDHDNEILCRLRVHGEGSVLNLSTLTNFSGSRIVNRQLEIEALAGGQILLPNIPILPTGAIDLLSSGSNSVINLASLTNFHGYNNFSFSGLEVTNFGSIVLNSNPITLSNLTVAIRTNGLLRSGPIRLLQSASLSGPGTLDLDIFGPPETLSTTGAVGSATLSGTLNINLPTDYTPPANTNYVILLGGSRSGTFSTFTYPTNRVIMQLNYLTNRVELQVVNSPPIVVSIPDQTIDELVPYSYFIEAEDEASQILTYAFSGSVPDGMALDANTGEITWTPTEEQGPSTNIITVIVTDNGPGALSHTNSFTLYVNEVYHAPEITQQPSDYTVHAGGLALFSVEAVGAQPLYYQWLFNGSNIAGATSSNLVMFSVSLSQAGNYSVLITNNEGSVTSDIAVLTVLETNKPTITLTAPSANQRLFTTPITVSGTAKDNVEVTTVQLRLNNGLFLPITLASNGSSINWSTTISPPAGTNTIQVRAIDWAGNVSSTITRTFFHVVTNQITLLTNGSGTIRSYANTFGGIGYPTNGAWLEVGRPYKIEAVPGTDCVFSNWSRIADGITNVFSTNALLSFNMESNLTLVANFISNPFITVAGNYNGLFYETNGIAQHSAGFINMRVRTNFAYSGRIRLDGDIVGFSGKFNVDGTVTKTIPRAKIGKDDLTLTMALDFASASDTVTGTLASSNWVATLLADRAIFSKTNITTAYTGLSTLLVPGLTNAAEGPTGYGAGTVKVVTNGTIRFSGFLADGHRVSQAVPVSKNGQWPFFLRLYRQIENQTNLLKLTVKTNAAHFKGITMGWLTFTNTTSTNKAPQGFVSWIKTTVYATNLFYPAGFTNETAIMASPYLIPAKGERLLNLTNGTVTLTEGNLLLPIAGSFELRTNNTALLTTTNEIANVKFMSRSGSFTVAFDHPLDGTNRLASAKGVVLQDQNFGAGWFKGTNTCGHLLLEPAD